jgi:metal-sulfur cluster biosynthetic enzyme
MPGEKAVLEAISKVKHPSIDCSLAELGIVQNLEVYGKNTVIATFVFPFQKIPIKDKLIGAVEDVAKKFGYNLEYIVRYMKEEEKKRFLELETENWKDNKNAAANCQS